MKFEIEYYTTYKETMDVKEVRQAEHIAKLRATKRTEEGIPTFLVSIQPRPLFEVAK